jgi:uncharacterized membrane protein
VKSNARLLLTIQISKLFFLVVLPFAAHAAEQVVQRQVTMASITLTTWLFVWMFSTGGWAIVHLDTLAEWFGPDGITQTVEEKKALLKERLKIVKNYIASILAGVGYFLLASSVPGWLGMNFTPPEMVIFVGAVPAAMGGSMTWDKFKGRFGL